MTTLANERKTDETGKATIEYITKNFEEASSKTVSEVVNEGISRGNTENKRKFQSLEDSQASLQDQVKESRAKLRKAELELKKLRSQVSNPNSNGGPAKGALQKNPTGKDNEKSVAFEDNPVKRRRRRGKKKQATKTRATKSRQCRQRFRLRTAKQLRKTVQDISTMSRQQSVRARSNQAALTASRAKANYGFIPDTSVTPFRNAVRLRANSSSFHNILPMPSNMAFHDLTPD
jgi:hypothetical protein